MSIHALSAAKSVCEMRDWRVSNLELQKILYLAHMFHLGRTNDPLIFERFEAWDYGPVIPDLYHRVKGFGNSPIRNVFHYVTPVPPGEELETLRESADATKQTSASRLVAITHWDGGAWAQCYRPGVSGLTIPNDLILAEYHARAAA